MSSIVPNSPSTSTGSATFVVTVDNKRYRVTLLSKKGGSYETPTRAFQVNDLMKEQFSLLIASLKSQGVSFSKKQIISQNTLKTKPTENLIGLSLPRTYQSIYKDLIELSSWDALSTESKRRIMSKFSASSEQELLSKILQRLNDIIVLTQYRNPPPIPMPTTGGFSDKYKMILDNFFEIRFKNKEKNPDRIIETIWGSLFSSNSKTS